MWDDEDWANQKDLYEWIKSHTGQTFFQAVFGFSKFDGGRYLRKNGNKVVWVGIQGDRFYLVIYGVS